MTCSVPSQILFGMRKDDIFSTSLGFSLALPVDAELELLLLVLYPPLHTFHLSLPARERVYIKKNPKCLSNLVLKPVM
jgi:hypothetical protein